MGLGRDVTGRVNVPNRLVLTSTSPMASKMSYSDAVRSAPGVGSSPRRAKQQLPRRAPPRAALQAPLPGVPLPVYREYLAAFRLYVAALIEFGDVSPRTSSGPRASASVPVAASAPASAAPRRASPRTLRRRRLRRRRSKRPAAASSPPASAPLPSPPLARATSPTFEPQVTAAPGNPYDFVDDEASSDPFGDDIWGSEPTKEDGPILAEQDHFALPSNRHGEGLPSHTLETSWIPSNEVYDALFESFTEGPTVAVSGNRPRMGLELFPMDRRVHKTRTGLATYAPDGTPVTAQSQRPSLAEMEALCAGESSEQRAAVESGAVRRLYYRSATGGPLRVGYE